MGAQKTILVLFLLAGAPTADMPPAVAQLTDADLARIWFLAHDRNHDGVITFDEVTTYEGKLFNRTDAKQTGRLREDEYCAGIPSYNTGEQNRCHVRFAEIDPDRDDYITLDEIQDYYRLVLQTADRRGDGRITMEEWLAVAVGN
jgi:Ca2+-binding EF-hand superfamily protein